MINQALIQFLQGIQQHNEKEWYDEHKEEYKTLRSEFTRFIEELGQEITQFDPAVAKAYQVGKPITKIFRIHRDARFSKNKAKYKTNISGFIAAGIKNDSQPAYYVSIEPGGRSYVGGGLFRPERLILSAVRDHIEMHPKTLAKIDQSKKLRAEFPAGLNRAHALKTAPRGHDVEHEAIEYLRLKSFTVGKTISDAELQKTDFSNSIRQSFKALEPLNAFLRP